MRFEGQVVIVTGGTRGIGRAITLGFAGEGARVVAIYRTRLETAEEILQQGRDRGLPGSIEVLRASVCDYEEMRETIRKMRGRHGTIDILVNNAGVFTNGYLSTMKPSVCDEMIDVNLKGTIHSSMAVARSMIAQRRGRIINVSSLVAFRNFAGVAAYAASKAGVVAFTRSLARELGPYGIVVNGIAPGLVDTEMIAGMDVACLDEYKAATLAHKILGAEEIARWVMVLASEEASSIQGETLIVGG